MIFNSEQSLKDKLIIAINWAIGDGWRLCRTSTSMMNRHKDDKVACVLAGIMRYAQTFQERKN